MKLSSTAATDILDASSDAIIVVNDDGDAAVIGRPPENVLGLID